MTEPFHNPKTRLHQEVRNRLGTISPEQREAAALHICSRMRQKAESELFSRSKNPPLYVGGYNDSVSPMRP